MTDGDTYNLLGEEKDISPIDRIMVEALTIKFSTDARVAVKTGVFKDDHIVSALLSVVANIVGSFPDKPRKEFIEQLTKNLGPAIEAIAKNYEEEKDA